MREHSTTSSQQSILSEVRERSRNGYARKQSILDPLLHARWCDEVDIERTYDLVRSSDQAVAVLLFQLPFRIRLPEKPIRLPAKEGNPYALFRTIGAGTNRLDGSGHLTIKERESFDKVEDFQNAELPHDPYGMLVRTQVIMSFQLWGPRQAFYANYLRASGNARAFYNVLVDGSKSWRADHTGMTCGIYEVDLFNRLALEAMSVMRAFLKMYAVACRDPEALAWRDMRAERLPCCFMMVQSGRLVVPRAAHSMIADFVRPVTLQDFRPQLRALKHYMERGRTPSEYEMYLLDAVRQLERGATDLAVVHAVMILEWFVNVVIEEHLVVRIRREVADPGLARFLSDRTWETQRGRDKWHVRIRLIDKFREYLPLAGVRLDPALLGRLEHVILIRNRIAHRSSKTNVSAAEALDAVDTGMQIINSAMDQLIGQRPPSRS